ncbi:UDP-N-acetylmuramoyl-tripeptide--D-alanyl-D-alanine ligase [Rhodoferax sp. AJA081-3]|uniref:UDP-N-acetylmuramoyl-tripeptide--D-alanyl-D- alanine ligase n=1 Tax=Rhodoferax sp. AJA081-3 TaxID=2752316 RepID=UPI001AE0B38B|nr:UDP-N-acetylmuramoyl-tripeptide--D-alanyl-D-alanine ligase [Rhodoferax sp. AJA081-3]QTN30692.1 UDP-N-acetylmuramoyl-tripeptide--D-alanyl-D-alanine ligase [Rhodoferax sp. AJA081-3]
MMTIAQAAQWLTGSHLLGDGAAVVQRVHTDTRSVEPGDLFVALKGERYDANAFLAEAAQRGAVAAICHPDADRSGVGNMACITVADTRLALGALAKAWRAQFHIPVIAVTGSNGKTTVTQMLASILAAHRPNDGALATRGNLNNDIGVPLTLLRLRPQHQIAVLELGMNHPGEIATLAAMVQPTVAVVNNAQREHMEFMHTVRAVALENGSVITAVGAQGAVVFPSDDEFTPLWQTLSGHRRTATFSLDGVDGPGALVCVQARWADGAWHVHARGLGQDLHYRLAIAGRHNVKNSLAAAAAALSAGVSVSTVVAGLQAFEPVKGRSKVLRLAVQGRSVTLVDDTYNANPDSVRAAIDVLADLPGPHLLVLGDMGEVGHQGAAFHAEAGRYAKAKGIETLLTLGELAQVAANAFEGAQHFGSAEHLIDALLHTLPHQHSVLVKGSRFMRMERVVQAMEPMVIKTAPPQEHPHAP